MRYCVGYSLPHMFMEIVSFLQNQYLLNNYAKCLWDITTYMISTNRIHIYETVLIFQFPTS